MKKTTIERIDNLTDLLKAELLNVWEMSVRSSHHFLSEDDLRYYSQRISDVYLQAVELYAVKSQRILAFMGLSEDMVEMLFVLPSEKGNGYGSALLDFAFQEKHIRKVDVNEQNAEACRFYLNRGYIVTGRDEVDSDGRP